MTMSDRGVHPDLLEEETAARAAAEAQPVETAPRTRSRRNGAARAAQSAPAEPTPEPEVVSDAASSTPDSETTSAPPAAEEPPSVPDWLQQARSSDDPQQIMAALLKNVPLEDLQKNPQIAGWIGDMGQKAARTMLAREKQQAAEREKADAWEKGDYYRLGELSAPEIQQRAQQDQQSQSIMPFMDGVTQFQMTLPPEVQQQIQSREYGVGKSYTEGVKEYLGAAVEAAVSHRLKDAVETEIKRREPALRKALLSETVGAEQTPELDNGRVASVREITDEQVDRMSLQEYEQYFDDNGRPRDGVRLRLTRGVDVSRR